MNTANLQLEGVLLIIASLVEKMRRKGLISDGDIEAVLDEAEANTKRSDAGREPISDANLDAILFPIRFLRVAVSGQGQASFTELAAAVGETKPGH